MPSAARILMCPPDFYGIEYEINPWMHRDQPADGQLAIAQWQGLRQQLEALGVEVLCLPPVPGLPDLVFTANAGVIHRERAILARFRHPERQGEEPHFAQWFAEHGFSVHQLRDGAYFEGAGDALFSGDTLVAGYRLRSDVRALEEAAAFMGCRVIPLELVNPHYYHLDTCFCPLAAGTAIYYPGAFDDYGRRALQDLVPTLVAVEEAEAWQFACNAVVVGKAVVVNTGCANMERQLQTMGFATYATPLGEFVKSGGSAKCLTLRLDGEEAAAWK